MSMTTTVARGSAALSDRPAVLHLKLRAAASSSRIEPSRLVCEAGRLQEILNHLYIIARNHRTWGDRLSQSLHRIADDILELEIYQPGPEEDLVAINNAKIKEIKRLIWQMKKEMLIEPLYGTELKDPVLEEDGWEWDNQMASIFIHTCRACGMEPISPFSKKNLAESLRPHSFAKAIIDWLDSLPEEYKHAPTEKDPTSAAVLFSAAGGPGVGDPKELIEEEELFTPVDPMSLPPVATPTDILSSLACLSSEDRTKLQSHLQESFAQRIFEREKLLQTQYFYLCARAADELAARISEGTYKPLEEATEDLREANAEIKARREEEERLAQERADRESQEIIDHIRSLCASHERHSEALNARINDAMDQLRTTRAELHEARMRIDRNESRIAALESRCRSLEGAVDGLRAQVGSSDGGGGCCIM